MNFQRTPLSSQGEEGPRPQQLFTQSLANPPPPHNTLLSQANPSNSSSQNSEHAPSIISISSSSPSYQSSSSGSGTEFVSRRGSVSTEQQVQMRSVMIPSTPQRGGPPNQFVLIQQQQQGPSESGGVGRGVRNTSTPKRGGSRKTPHTAAAIAKVVEETGKEEDEIQIVAEKGVNPKRRGVGARRKRIDCDVTAEEAKAMEEERIMRTRENEKRRREMQKEGAERLRDLVPGLKDGKSRKVGEGIVMQKAAEYIEQLEEEQKRRRSNAKSVRQELVKCFVDNLVNHKVIQQDLTDLQQQSREGKVVTVPPLTRGMVKQLAPSFDGITNPVVKEEVKKMFYSVLVKHRKPASDSAGQRPAPPEQSTASGVQTPRAPAKGQAVVKVENSNPPGLIPITAGISQGRHQGPVRTSSPVRQRPQQQLAVPTVASTSGVPPHPSQTPRGQGQDQQLAKVVPVGYRHQQRPLNPQILVGSHAQFRVGSSPIPGILTLRQSGSIGGNQVVRLNTPRPNVQHCLVRCGAGVLRNIGPQIIGTSNRVQLGSRVVGGDGGVDQDGLSKPMSLINLKQEEGGAQLTPRVLGDLKGGSGSGFENFEGGAGNLADIKTEPMDLELD